jgi:hypothetical protein
MSLLPSNITNLLGSAVGALDNWNVLDSDTAGTVKSVLGTISGQGTGTPANSSTTVPATTVSPVSASAKPAVQQASQPLSTTTLLIIGGIAVVGLLLAFKK